MYVHHKIVPLVMGNTTGNMQYIQHNWHVMWLVQSKWRKFNRWYVMDLSYSPRCNGISSV